MLIKQLQRGSVFACHNQVSDDDIQVGMLVVTDPNLIGQDCNLILLKSKPRVVYKVHIPESVEQGVNYGVTCQRV